MRIFLMEKSAFVFSGCHAMNKQGLAGKQSGIIL